MVATATSNLCEAANMVVQGQAKEEKLITAAKAVASSTAQLLISCQVKADARSENNRRLQVRPHPAFSVAVSYCILVFTALYSHLPPSLLPPPSPPRPQMAGAAVKKATETLVKAAQQASLNEQEEEPFMKPKVKGKVMADFRQELEAQEEIARKQRELQRAMEQLNRIRRERSGH